jgi:hypothetical protein
MGRHNEKLVKPICVVGQHVRKPADLGGQIRLLAQPQVDDAGVGLPQPKHQLAKVTIVRDEDPLLGERELEHCPVRQSGSVLTADPGCIMTLGAKKLGEAGISTLIEQKAHT